MDEHEYNVQRLLILDLYWEGTITIFQYVEQLNLLELNYRFNLT